MLKKLFALTLSALLGVIALSGCSCSNEVLSFSNGNGFNNGQDPAATHTEKLVYDVTFNENATDYYAKNENIDNLLKLEFTDGKYVSEFKVLTDLTEIPEDIKSEISVQTLYSLTTEFAVRIKVTAGDKTYEHDDRIETKTLFLPQGFSFAPVYSESESSCLLPYLNSDGAKVTLLCDRFTVQYSKDKYAYAQTVDYIYDYTTDMEDAVVSRTDTSSDTVKYNFRSLIDNAQLLFVLRNIKLEEKASFNLPVLSESYKETKTLSVTNDSSLEKKINIKYNGEETEDTVKYDLLTFRINSSTNAGLKQFVSVQSAAGATVKNYALPIEYARAVTIVGGSYPIAGTLVFSLAEVEINDQ